MLPRRRFIAVAGTLAGTAAGAGTVLPPAAAHAGTPRHDEPGIPAPSIDVVTRTAHFGEGLVVDATGQVFVSDPFASRIDRLAGGRLETWSTAVRSPNGHKILPDGTHVVMEQGSVHGGTAAQPAGVALLSPSGSLLRLITRDDQGRPFDTPNDVAVDRRRGGFWFTDPGPFGATDPVGRVFRVTADLQLRTVSTGEIAFPNGVVVGPGRDELTVGESLRNRLLSFRISPDGRSIRRARVLATLPSQPNPWTNGEAQPDGIALDTRGRLWVCHFGTGDVRVVSAHGEVIASVGTGSSSVTNLAFLGERRDQLLVAAANGNSFAELDRGGHLVRLGLPGVSGARLV